MRYEGVSAYSGAVYPVEARQKKDIPQSDFPVQQVQQICQAGIQAHVHVLYLRRAGFHVRLAVCPGIVRQCQQVGRVVASYVILVQQPFGPPGSLHR